MKNILDSRVKNQSGYCLQETILNLKDKRAQMEQIVNEIEALTSKYSTDSLQEGSIVGKGIYRLVAKLITTAIQVFADTTSGDVGGAILLVPALAKNSYDLNKSNKAIRPILDKVQQQNLTPKDIKDLEEIVGEIKVDIADLVRAIVIALPLPALDEAAGAILGFMEDTSVAQAQSAKEMIRAAAQSGGLRGFIVSVLSYVGYFAGGAIFGEALDNLEEAEAVLAAGGVMTINLPAPEIKSLEDLQRISSEDPNVSDQTGDVDGDGILDLNLDSSGDMPPPSRGSHLRIVDPDDMSDIDSLGPNNLSESKINLNRWKKLSGLS